MIREAFIIHSCKCFLFINAVNMTASASVDLLPPLLCCRILTQVAKHPLHLDTQLTVFSYHTAYFYSIISSYSVFPAYQRNTIKTQNYSEEHITERCARNKSVYQFMNNEDKISHAQ